MPLNESELTNNMFDVRYQVMLNDMHNLGFMGQMYDFKMKMNNLRMMGCELDIVHPDTPQGRLGTKSMNPREQDARNNFRPGFSQVEKSMKKIFKNAHVKNTISLRTLISPPGYQIARFYINYSLKDNKIITKDYFKKNIIKFCKKNKFKIQYTESSLGRRAFEKVLCVQIIQIIKVSI